VFVEFSLAYAEEALELNEFNADAADAETPSTTTNLLFTEEDKVEIVVSCPASLTATAEETADNSASVA